MTLKKLLTIGAVAAAALGAAAPASAVITDFATFKPTAGSAINFVWVNDSATTTVAGGAIGSTNYRYNGTGGSLFSTNSTTALTPGQSTPAAIAIKFSFVDPLLAPTFTNIDALLSFSATSTTPAVTASGFKIQGGLTGTFTITAVTPLSFGTVVNKTNLLTGTFSDTAIFGQSASSSGSFGGSINGGSTISYTSDFLSFNNTSDLGISFSLNSLLSKAKGNSGNAGLNNAAGKALRSFSTTAQGTFSADPNPVVNGVPEPKTWAMLLVGFGMVGFAARRRSGKANIAA